MWLIQSKASKLEMPLAGEGEIQGPDTIGDRDISFRVMPYIGITDREGTDDFPVPGSTKLHLSVGIALGSDADLPDVPAVEIAETCCCG